MKILVLGASGFIGRNVCLALSDSHEVYAGTMQEDLADDRHVYANLLDKERLVSLFNELSPDVIVNCAGVIDATKDVSLNKTFTENILEAVTLSNINPQRVIIVGSAGEYGVVGSEQLPVSEDTELAATTEYGLSKVQETTFARDYAKQHNVSLVVARIFNPLGPGMHEKFLTSRIMYQISEIKDGSRNDIEITRLDARRDYIDVRDVASAIMLLVEAKKPLFDVYNIGSGIATSNKELIELFVKSSKMVRKPIIVETGSEPEPIFAVQGDVTRMHNEFGWNPTITLSETIKEIIDDARRRRQD